MKALTLTLTPLLVLSLAGCTLIGGGGGTDPVEDDGSSGGEALEGGTTSCLVDRNWQLDVSDAAQQLREYMSSGMNIISVTGDGEQGLFFDHLGIVGSATNLSYTIVVDMGEGSTMTMVQHHEGSPGGNWSFDGEDESWVVYDGWNGDYTITTDTSIDGMAAPTQVNPMGGGLGAGEAMTISCEGDTLTTQAEGSPFTQVWHAID